MIFMEPLSSAAESCTNPTEMDIYLTSADIQTSQLDIYLGNLDIHRIQPTLYHEPKERVNYQHQHHQHYHPQLVRQASVPASFAPSGPSSTTRAGQSSAAAPQLTRGQSWESSGYPDSESHPGSVVSTSDGSEALWDLFSSDDDEVDRKIER
eukprot:sb/3473405/